MPVEKRDCIEHVQKRMGTALRNLKVIYRGQKLSDGKTIGGIGRLTGKKIDSLQNYYGKAIRTNIGDLQGMMKAVQATLLHSNSTDEMPRHNLCLEGKDSWYGWQRAKVDKKEHLYQHKDPIPQAIVPLIQPIYARLGSKSLLEKCLHGYTQNANESLHHIIWQFCPKELFLERVSVDIACALGVLYFNDGASSLKGIAERLQIELTPIAIQFFNHKDRLRIKKSVYQGTTKAKTLRKRRRRIRKGLQDKYAEKEGVVYGAGAFGAGTPVPSTS